MKFRFCTTIFLSLIISFTSLAADINISEQYVRETIPGTSISSAYMKIGNQSNQPVTLTNITSSISDRIEMHEHIMTEDMMKMQQVDSIVIKANDSVVLQPHGYHIMVFNLEQPLQADTEMTMTLHFDNKENVTIAVPVQGLKQLNKKRHQH
ncbi:copper chaperone PCu(A)C [Thalassotalea nanhaiensis]|uniref:Copper chaperone PCu(A)C n=1 Tax=Thalassotalea nanhaiensis TaxID=3065648 RepID=A0ABY9TKA9_9GAMM|nr:copper chaperone PCu(A)C [Colwelliaceae bacterium SQ345]